MKQIIRYIILVNLLLLGVNASSVKWAPIMMADITMFVPYEIVSVNDRVYP